MKYSQDLVRSIFFASDQNHRVDEQMIADVCFLLSENLLNFSRQKIASKDIYHQYLDDLESGKIKKFTIEGGGNGHLALKLIGQDFLHQQGRYNLKFEQEFCGYRPDIMTSDGKIIVECGNTNPDKIFYYFKDMNLYQVIIIPYPVAEADEILAYTFWPSPELRDFLIFKSESEAQKLRNIKDKP